MNTSGEFKTIAGQEIPEQPNVPKVFGIPMTPPIIGILLGLLGVGAFLYIWSTFVTPVIESKKQLVEDKELKETQLRQLQSGELERRIQELQVELQREQELEPQVFSMFSDERTLDTLLLDVNNFIEASQAQLVTYEPESAEPVVINDGSLGTLVNERLKRKRSNVVIEGTFEQIQSVVQDIERLQPLLLIKNFETTVTENPVYTYQQGRVNVEGETKLTSSFVIDAILPRNPEDIPQPEAEETEAEAEAES